MYALAGGGQESLGEKTGGRQTGQQKKNEGENVFFTSRLPEAANDIVQSKKMGIEEKIRQLAKLYVEAKSGEDKKFIANALSGQIEFLSNKSTLGATQKIKLLEELPWEIGENKPLLDAVAKAYTDQVQYLKDKANNVLDATFFAQMQIASPMGDPLFGLIKEEVWLSKHDAKWYTQYVKKGTEQELDPGKIPNNILQCAKDYYETQILAADKLLTQQKKRNPPNGTILGLLEGIKSNAKEHIWELQSIGKPPSQDEKLEVVKGLIKFNHNHLQAAMQKIGEENHWDQLYSAQGDSKFMKFLVYNVQHAHTGQLWCAFALSCINPLAGKLAFGLMGSKEMAEGISNQNYSQIFFGLSMMAGMSKNPMVGGVAGAYMNASIFKGMYGQIASGLNTGFTAADVENLGNNLVLLAGFYKAKTEQGGGRNKSKNNTTKNEKKDLKNEKPENRKPEEETNSRKGAELDAYVVVKKPISLEVSNEIDLAVKNLAEKNGITFRPEELSLILKDPRVENILVSKNFTPQDVGRVTESLLRIAKDSPELLEVSVDMIESYGKLDQNLKYSLTNFLADQTSPLKAKLDLLADPKIFEPLSRMGEKSWEAFVNLSGIWGYTFEMMPKTENGRVLAQKKARETISSILSEKTAEEVLRAAETWSAKRFIEKGDYPTPFKSVGDAETFLLKKYGSMVEKLAERKTELQAELVDRQGKLENETDINKKTELERQVAETQNALEIVREFEKNPGAFRTKFMDEIKALNSTQTQVQKDALRMIANDFEGTYQADLLSKLSPIGLVVPEQFFTIYSKVSRGNAEGCAFVGNNLFLVGKNSSVEKMIGTALHEAYHSLSYLNGGGKVFVEPFMKIGDKRLISKPEIVTHLNEGLTDYYAMKTALKNGLEYEPGYPVEIKTAFYLENIVGKETLLHAYLTSDFLEVARRFDQVMGEGQFTKFIREKDGVIASIYLDKATVKEYAKEHPNEKVAWHEFSLEKMKERAGFFKPKIKETETKTTKESEVKTKVNSENQKEQVYVELGENVPAGIEKNSVIFEMKTYIDSRIITLLKEKADHKLKSIQLREYDAGITKIEKDWKEGKITYEEAMRQDDALRKSQSAELDKFIGTEGTHEEIQKKLNDRGGSISPNEYGFLIEKAVSEFIDQNHPVLKSEELVLYAKSSKSAAREVLYLACIDLNVFSEAQIRGLLRINKTTQAEFREMVADSYLYDKTKSNLPKIGRFKDLVLNADSKKILSDVPSLVLQKMNKYSPRSLEYLAVKLASAEMPMSEALKSEVIKYIQTNSEIQYKLLFNRIRHGTVPTLIDVWKLDVAKPFKKIPQEKYTDFFGSWLSVRETDSRSDLINNNLRRAIELEKSRPGAVSVLYFQYGIRNLGRYDLPILERQYDIALGKVVKSDKPLLSVVYPYSDWNGAFSSNIKGKLGPLSENFEIVISEAKNPIEMKLRLSNINEVYGEISVMFLGGHGNPKEIKLDAPLTAKSFKDMRGFFVENPTMVLISCSTGKYNTLPNNFEGWTFEKSDSRSLPIEYNNGLPPGFGRKASEGSDFYIYAPKSPTNIESINYIGKNTSENHIFEIKWKPKTSKGGTEYLEAGAEYSNGKPVKTTRLSP